MIMCKWTLGWPCTYVDSQSHSWIYLGSKPYHKSSSFFNHPCCNDNEHVYNLIVNKIAQNCGISITWQGSFNSTCHGSIEIKCCFYYELCNWRNFTSHKVIGNKIDPLLEKLWPPQHKSNTKQLRDYVVSVSLWGSLCNMNILYEICWTGHV